MPEQPTLTRGHQAAVYDSDAFLAMTVVDLLAAALAHGDLTVVIATPEHRAIVDSALRARGLDPDRLTATGRLVVHDAAQVLARMQCDGTIDVARVTAVARTFLAAATGARTVHIYGEMVGLLWDRGDVAGAMLLEDTLHGLRQEHPLDMHCGYHVTDLDTAEADGSLAWIRQRHTSTHLPRPVAVSDTAWLDALAGELDDGLVMLDRGGRTTYANPAAHRLLGDDGVLALGEPLSARLAGAPVSMTDPVGMAPGRPVQAVWALADGRQIPIEYITTPLPGEEGHPTGWSVVVRDISGQIAQRARWDADVARAQWVVRIQDAIEHDQLTLHAQPIIDVATGQVVQHELLVRLDDPDTGLVLPGAFMPTAEHFGIVTAIDEWVLTRAVGLASRGHRIHVNLSARTFSDPSLPHLIDRLLEKSGADPANLVFELTETALLDNGEAAQTFAERIHQLGCVLALDDFGTGYGAFTYLKQLPVDLLKIDMEFVRDAVESPASRHVIAAIVSLARSFDITTVAEGVEDQATMDLLATLGVDLAQGFHLGRPGPLSQVGINDPDPVMA